jgi:hypothetical protein
MGYISLEQSAVDPRHLSSYRNIETFRNIKQNNGRLWEKTKAGREHSRTFTMGKV